MQCCNMSAYMSIVRFPASSSLQPLYPIAISVDFLCSLILSTMCTYHWLSWHVSSLTSQLFLSLNGGSLQRKHTNRDSFNTKTAWKHYSTSTKAWRWSSTEALDCTNLKRLAQRALRSRDAFTYFLTTSFHLEKEDKLRDQVSRQDNDQDIQCYGTRMVI
jgi:hypothetical protein